MSTQMDIIKIKYGLKRFIFGVNQKRSSWNGFRFFIRLLKFGMFCRNNGNQSYCLWQITSSTTPAPSAASTAWRKSAWVIPSLSCPAISRKIPRPPPPTKWRGYWKRKPLLHHAGERGRWNISDNFIFFGVLMQCLYWQLYPVTALQ